MDIAASPIVTVILNLIAGYLVSKGILDSHSAIAFVQLANNIIAALVTLGLGIYSIYKMVDLRKHKLGIVSQGQAITTSTPVITVTAAQPNNDTITLNSQTGLPLSQ